MASTQPATSSIHVPQPAAISTHPTAAPPGAASAPPGPVQSESEGSEAPAKTVGRDAIQALDKKLRSLFKDQSSSSASMEANQGAGTSSPPAGTTSPPPGTVTAMAPPSNLALNPGVQGVTGATTTPGQGVTPGGHALTPPSKPRAQVGVGAEVHIHPSIILAPPR